jgi:hypothetical protein
MGLFSIFWDGQLCFVDRIWRIDRHGDRIHMHLHEPAVACRFASTWTQPNTIGSRP